MQGYDRNGKWTDEASLAMLQRACYEEALREPRSVGINIFSYGRPGGSRDHSELVAEHRQIALEMGVA
jgi:hypothetical protein